MARHEPFPDIEAACISALVGANVAGGNVASRIPASGDYPCAVVRRLGGVPAVERRLDTARIQVDVWADDHDGAQAEARDIADAARLALHALEGEDIADGFVTAVVDESGLMLLPDPDTGRDRYLFSVFVYAHAASFPTTT